MAIAALGVLVALGAAYVLGRGQRPMEQVEPEEDEVFGDDIGTAMLFAQPDGTYVDVQYEVGQHIVKKFWFSGNGSFDPDQQE